MQKTLRRLRHQHRPPIAREQQDAVLQITEDLVEVFFQGGEDLFDIAHALADLLDFG